MSSLERRRIGSDLDLDALRRDAVALMASHQPERALDLVRAARATSGNGVRLRALRAETEVRCAIAMEDEKRLTAALGELERSDVYDAARWLALTNGRLALGDLRVARRGLIAHFDLEGRSLLRTAREEVRGIASDHDDQEAFDQDVMEFDEALADHGPGPAADTERELWVVPSPGQREQASALLARAYSCVGRPTPTPEGIGWAHSWHDGVRPVPAFARPAIPVDLDAATQAFAAARDALEIDLVLAAGQARLAIDALIAACTPAWPARGGPWWSSLHCGFVADLSMPTDARGWARVALADVIAELEDSDELQQFWWPGWPDHDGDGAPHLVASLLCLVHEALGYAATSGLAPSG